MGCSWTARWLFTRGQHAGASGALLAYVAPATGRVHLPVQADDEADGQPLVGQVQHTAGSTFARLIFLAPEAALQSADLPALFEPSGVCRSGERGAFHVLAEVDERSPAFEALRQSGFAIYARQRIWRLEVTRRASRQPSDWRQCTGQDTLRVRSLYADLVPGLVQQVEPLPRQRLKGMVLLSGWR